MRLKALLPYFTGTQDDNTGWYTVLNSTTQTGQDRVLRESGRGRRPFKARLATSLSRVRAGGDSLNHERRSSHSPPHWGATASAWLTLRSPRNQLLSRQKPLLLCVTPPAVSLSLSRPRHIPSSGQSGTRYPPGGKLRPSVPPPHQC